MASDFARYGLYPDVTLTKYRELIADPCVYCRDNESERGLDRIDNSLPHTLSNVVPCCALCNLTRAHRFTPQEMKEFIGPSIAKVKFERLKNLPPEKTFQPGPSKRKPFRFNAETGTWGYLNPDGSFD
jgi:hypothetical protein